MLTLRTVKGSRLTWNELDQNFLHLDARADNLQAQINSPLAWSLDSSEIFGDKIIRGPNSLGDAKIDFDGFVLTDNANLVAAKFDERQLIDITNIPSLRWETRELYDKAGIISLNWEEREVYNDLGGATALSWHGTHIIASLPIRANDVDIICDGPSSFFDFYNNASPPPQFGTTPTLVMTNGDPSIALGEPDGWLLAKLKGNPIKIPYYGV